MIDRTELHALADNELPPERSAELKSQLDRDPASLAELEAIHATKRCLRSCANDVDASTLWVECRDRLDEVDRTKRIESFVGRYAWGICGLFFVAIALGGFFNRSLPRSADSNQVAGYVANMAPISRPAFTDAGADDRMFRQVLGESFNRPQQVRITDIGVSDEPGRRVSMFRCDDGYGPVVVLALHDIQQVTGLYEYEKDTRYKCGEVSGAPALFWNRADGVICVAFGNRAYGEIYRMLTLLSQ
jgi:hypothetical protein